VTGEIFTQIKKHNEGDSSAWSFSSFRNREDDFNIIQISITNVIIKKKKQHI
jgi:hypothetical protein